MKSRLLILAQLVAVGVLLVACGKSQETIKAENDIATIGEVELEDKELIDSIVDYVNSLTDEQKEAIENIDILKNAESKLEQLIEEDNKRQIDECLAKGLEYLKDYSLEDRGKNALAEFQKADELGSLDGSFMSGYVLDWVLEDGDGQDFVKAREYYEKCQDNPFAYGALAFLYMNGQGVEVDEDLAKEYADRAYELLDSQADLSDCEKAYGSYVAMQLYNLVDNSIMPLDYEKVMEWLLVGDSAGNAQCTNLIGSVYADGRGIEQDYAKAMEWYSKAADKGYDFAMSNIAVMYQYGEGVDADCEKAIEWYEKSGDAGNAQGYYAIGRLYQSGNEVEQDYAKAMLFYSKAAEMGHAVAMNQMGFMYEQGLGLDNDYEKAIEWYTKGVEGGDSSAAANLGGMYRYGKGVDKDLAKCEEYYMKAAEFGDGWCIFNLAYAYYEGKDGLPKDWANAARLYEICFNYGGPSAVRAGNNLAWLYRTGGNGLELDYNKALIMFNKVIDYGFDESGEALYDDVYSAVNNLGWMYEHGEGVEVDYEKAFELYLQAAEGGNKQAMINVAQMYAFGRGCEKDDKKGKAWSDKAYE